MKLYDCKDAVNGRRVRMFLAEKDVDVPREEIDIGGGENLSDAYRQVNPAGLIPCLRLDDGQVIGESIAICRFFEALHPEPNLFGKTPKEAAVVESWERRMEREGILSIAYAFRETTPVFRNRAVPGSPREFAQIEALAERGKVLSEDFLTMLDARLGESEYVGGDRFTVADITGFVSCGFAKWIGLDPANHGDNIARWYSAMKTRPSSKA
ncbi:glutathione S-transferase [Novosphingobium marinum]|uniref:Glutathione S-transferase n=1 Tax=Novosphingobium marinum TaxID=1514948 RepID=A0A7Y9XYE2_9SPHN|nr:glutathione S-transferase family protein [Novosphingobium marinum]NYH96745.1 glutathione S-transferase [Novosphingobium marinum]GGC40542.1 glutathione S-transferase [Novosphingobium marinum]